MSQSILISSLSQERCAKLAGELTFHSTQELPRNAKSWNSTTKSVVCFVRDDQVTLTESEEGDKNKLRIPFAKAVALRNTSNDAHEHLVANIAKKDGMDLRPDQKENAIAVVNFFNEKRSCTLCLGAGGGKTASACVIATVVKKLVVVLVQNKLLLSQWEKEFQKFTTAVTHIVEKGKAIANDTDVLICHIRRYQHIPRKLRDLVGFMIIDESPLLCNQQGVNAILAFQPKFILALTATPSRSRDGMYRVMQAFVGTSEVISKQKKNMHVTMIKTQWQAEKVKGARGTMIWATYIQSLLYNMARNEAIVNAVLEDVKQTGRKVMILTTETKHVSLLHELLTDAGADADWLSGKKQAYRNCQILVGNIQKCGVGFDDANFCTDFDGVRISIIWIVSQIGNKETAEQAIGRARDNSPLIRHVVDNESSAQKHWCICRKVYIAGGAKIEYIKWDV